MSLVLMVSHCWLGLVRVKGGLRWHIHRSLRCLNQLVLRLCRLTYLSYWGMNSLNRDASCCLLSIWSLNIAVNLLVTLRILLNRLLLANWLAITIWDDDLLLSWIRPILWVLSLRNHTLLVGVPSLNGLGREHTLCVWRLEHLISMTLWCLGEPIGCLVIVHHLGLVTSRGLQHLVLGITFIGGKDLSWVLHLHFAIPMIKVGLLLNKRDLILSCFQKSMVTSWGYSGNGDFAIN